jgi:tetratricopeptide (TPR) repeat protein
MTRHELKSQDEITSTIQRITELAYARTKQIVIGLSVVAAIVLAIVGWSLYSANRNANAQSQLSAAIGIYNDTTNIKVDKERYEKTLAEAQKTYDAYGSTAIGPIAKYYVGISQEGLGDTNGAVQSLQEVIASGDSRIRGVAQFALAGIHKKHGETAKAIEIYKQLYDGGEYSKSAATLELARLYEAGNQVEQAKEHYTRLLSEFPDSPFRQDADQALKRLGVTPPAPQNPS